MRYTISDILTTEQAIIGLKEKYDSALATRREIINTARKSNASKIEMISVMGKTAEQVLDSYTALIAAQKKEVTEFFREIKQQRYSDF